ncbi:AEC family transporter [Spirulina subsalsa]|uniref:AEC family transporter n=1 Tax=Spirulina subsalsa TaxID=54311 RepID=UPI00031ECE50|nr:AEC family transporter [Spirulina subsalsa]
MFDLSAQLIPLYTKLIGGVLVGWLLGRTLPQSTCTNLGKFLFWVGVPLGNIIFLRWADLSNTLWISPLIALIAIVSGATLAAIWLKLQSHDWTSPRQGSFVLTSMVGNTGYLGYPIVLTLAGEQHFALALFYDMFGTVVGAYGLGVILAAYFGKATKQHWELFIETLRNPIWWAFAFGLFFRQVVLPVPVESTLKGIGWGVISLSLVLIGMRLSQLHSFRQWRSVSISLGIKMILIPLVFGLILAGLGIRGMTQLVLVLQMAMPPAFATLVLTETYALDWELTVSAIAIGSMGLLLTLPVWVFLFG